MKKIILLFLSLLFLTLNTIGQDRFLELENSLEKFTINTPALNELVELSVDDIPIADFVRMLSKSNELNISIQEGVEGNVINDFNNARVKDVLIYLCKEYELDIEFIGNILFFKKYIAPQEIVKPVEKIIDISYNSQNKFLSINLKDEDISEVAQAISEKSGKSVVVYPQARGTKVSSYIQNRPFDNVLDKITSSNGLIVTKTKDDFYVINKEIIQRKDNKKSKPKGVSSSNESVNITVKNDLFSIAANDAPISDIIMMLSEKLNISYFFYSFPTEKTTLNVNNMNFEEFLTSILTGTKHTYKKAKNVYLIGERLKEGFRATELITLRNRSVEKVLEIIPADLKKGVKVNVFNDLNGLVVSGSSEEIYELKSFIETIDIVVPVITIDLIIVEVNKRNGISAGVEAGLGTTSNNTVTNGNTANGQIQLSTSSINQLVQSINGLGLFNLGNVAPNFYMNIQALETNGILKIKSTPKIATLNGEEATLSIGNEEFYLEVQNQFVTTGLNQTPVTSQTYKSQTAELKIKIKPFVSEDEQISLTIDFQQETFTGKISELAPPNKSSRSFNSVIRVKNDEMILLGGLEERKKENSGSGIPFLSRVPILKWIFGKRTKQIENKKLHIFIRPHVTY